MRTLMSMATQMRRRQSVRPAGSLNSVSHKRTASGNENSCAGNILDGHHWSRSNGAMPRGAQKHWRNDERRCRNEGSSTEGGRHTWVSRRVIHLKA